MARHRRRRSRGFGGLGVLPLVGALTLPKVALLAAGAWAAWRVSKSSVPVDPGSGPSVDATVGPAVLPANRGQRPGAAVGNKLFQPGSPSASAARDAVQAILKTPIGNDTQLVAAVRTADNYLMTAAKAGLISSADAQRIASQPPADKVLTVATMVGVQPTLIPASTSSLLVKTLSPGLTATVLRR